MQPNTYFQQSAHAHFITLRKRIEHIPRDRAKDGHHRRVEMASGISFQNLHGGIEANLALVGPARAEGIEDVGKREYAC